MGFRIGGFFRGAVGGFLRGGPLGAITGGAQGGFGRGQQQYGGNLLAQAARASGLPVAQVQRVAQQVRAQTGIPGQALLQSQAFQGGGAYRESTGVSLIPPSYSRVRSFEAQVGAAPQQVMGPGAACPKGFRVNKSTYVTRGGGTSRWPVGLTVHPKGSECVRVRRRNVGNAKALRRAVSRLRGFAKMAQRVQRALGIGGKRRVRARAALPAGTSVVNVE